MRYVVARYNEKQRDMAYRIYITDALKTITEDIAHANGGKYMTLRYYDVINPKPVDSRSGDEVAADVIMRLGLSFG